MLELVITGGQTGADEAAWRAAANARLPTGGWMPAGFLTESGPRPEFAVLYGARAHELPSYPPRTRANVADADGVLLFDAARWPDPCYSAGTQLAIDAAAEERAKRPGATSLLVVKCVARRGVVVPLDTSPPPPIAAAWIRNRRVRRLMVGGNRESTAPGMGAAVYLYATELFRLLGEPAGGQVEPGLQRGDDQG